MVENAHAGTDAASSMRLATVDYALCGAAIAAAGLVTIVSVGDFGVRLAMAPADDGPVAFSYAFARPDEFARDGFMMAWMPVAGASAMNLIPALALRYLSIPPEWFFVGFTLAQSMLLALAVFHLGITMTRDRWTAALAVAFTILWRPYAWNLGLFGALDTQPYASWLALPFFVFALSWALNQKTVLALASLLVGGLIHPTFALCCAAILGAYITVSSSGRERMINCVGVAVAAAMSFAPVAISTLGIETVPDASRLSLLMRNPHIAPWGLHYPFGIAAYTSATLYTVLLTALAWQGSDGRARRLLMVTAVGTAVLSAVHYVSLAIGAVPIITLILHRSSALLIMVALPAALHHLLQSARLNVWTTPAIAVFLLRASPISLAAAALVTLRGRVFGPLGWLAGTALALTIVLRDDHAYSAAINKVLNPPLDGWQNWLLADNRWFVFSTAAWVATAIALAATRRLKPVAVTVVAAICIVAAAREAQVNANTEIEGLPRHYYEAQLWARNNTPPGTGFLQTDTVPQSSWRGVARRPTLYPTPATFAYVNFRFAAEFNERLRAFRERYGDDWKAFGREFGADYLVERAALPRQPFREAYRNQSFVIYDLR